MPVDKCGICGGDTGTPGCMSTWKHPRMILDYGPVVPLDGPGSHIWDLREMQAQRARADKAEALAEVLARALGLAEWGGGWTPTNNGACRICPVCGKSTNASHASSCELAAALAAYDAMGLRALAAGALAAYRSEP